jgi:hypothetical protein
MGDEQMAIQDVNVLISSATKMLEEARARMIGLGEFGDNSANPSFYTSKIVRIGEAIEDANRAKRTL